MIVGAEAEQVAEAFIDAVVGGDLQAMLDVLAPDVVLLSDGGGIVSAARRPIMGPDKVARFLLGVVPKAGDIAITWCEVNGEPSVLVTGGDVVLGVGSCIVVDGKVTAIHFVLNPEKLGRLTSVARLTRS